MKRLSYTKDDGTITIVAPTDEFLAGKKLVDKELVDNKIEGLIDIVVPENNRASAKVIDISSINPDRTFRNAWEQGVDGDPVTNMTKANELAKEKIREVRIAVFDKLDVDFQRATENNDTAEASKVAAKKNKARDATKDPRLNVPTEAELKTAMLSIQDEIKAL